MTDNQIAWGYIRTNLSENKKMYQTLKSEMIEIFQITLQTWEIKAMVIGKVIEGKHIVVDSKGIWLENKPYAIRERYQKLNERKFEIMRELKSLNYEPNIIQEKIEQVA